MSFFFEKMICSLYAVCTQFVCSLYVVLKLHTVLVKLHTLLSKPYVVLQTAYKLHTNCV